MNYALVFYVLGWVLKFESAFLLLPFVVAVIYREPKPYIYLIVAGVCLLLGFVLSRKKPQHFELYNREGFLSVGLSWIVMSLLGAVPFVLTKDIPNYVDALFETVSGFTTTGASILTNVEGLSHSGLFWRSFTHWIGGMGVFVFIMAILPMMGGSSINLMRAESTGPAVDRLVPKVKNTAKILYGIYIFLTVLEIILLKIFGMPLFECFATAFGTIGTGGFGIKNDSFCSYTPALQNIVTIFMILSGINYVGYFYLLLRQFKKIWCVEEIKWYLAIILASVAIIVFNIRDMYSIPDALRHAFFQVASIITTTGFCTCDYDQWPQLSKTILILLMFIGACAGSTGGGIKVSRIIILIKSIKNEVKMIVHPRAVKKIELNGQCISSEAIRSTNVFIAIYFFILFLSVLLLSLDNLDFTTNFTAVVATLNNIGPGFELVGPAQNYSVFGVLSKFVLIFNMIAGRLELFPILILFSKVGWSRK